MIDLIALQGDHALAGAITFWALSENVEAAALRAALVTAGLPEDWAPEMPSPRVALSRALKQETNNRTLFERMSDGSYSVIALSERGRVDGEKADVTTRALETKTIATVRVDGLGRLRMEAEDDLDPVTQDLITRVRSTYAQHLDTVGPTDMGVWLCKMMGKIDGVALRETGGIYFVPRPELTRLQALANAVKAASKCRVHTVPALTSDEASEAVFSAIVREADAEAAALRADVDNPDIGSRAMATRAARAKLFEAKLEKFDSILGDKIDALRATAAQVTVAVYAARVILETREAAR